MALHRQRTSQCCACVPQGPISPIHINMVGYQYFGECHGLLRLLEDIAFEVIKVTGAFQDCLEIIAS